MRDTDVGPAAAPSCSRTIQGAIKKVARARRQRGAQSVQVVCGSQRLPNNRDL